MKLFKKTIPITVLSLLLTLTVSYEADGNDQEELKGYLSEVEEAIAGFDAESLTRLAHDISSMCETGEATVRKYACYYAGYIHYRLGTMFPDIDESQQDDHLDEAISYLEQSIDIDPDFAEAHSLIGSSYGSKISGMISGMRYGSTSGEHLEKGVELAPENPRTVMMHAISLLMRPSMAGGDTEEAMAEFRRAAELFETWSPDHELDPEWGHEQAYAWLGIAHMQEEQYDRAEEALEQSLEVNPDYGWVTEQLMPELEERR